jgi:hypothetical protein
LTAGAQPFGAFYYHGDGAYDPLEVRGSFFTVDVQTRQVTDAYAALARSIST